MTISENIIIDARNNTRQAFASMGADAQKASSKIMTSMKGMSGELTKAGIAIGTVGAVGVGLMGTSTLLAARVQTLGVVLKTVGRNAGYSEQQLNEYEGSVKSMGITTQAARQSLIRMVQANLDLSKSSQLARVAQDAAVIAGINSSEAFERLLHGVTTLQPEILRTMGIIVNIEGEVKKYAEANGVAVDSIDATTKQMIAMNAVLEAGQSISGSYSAAMDTAGKKMASLDRLVEEAKLALGEAFLPAMSDAISAASSLLKRFNDLDPATKTAIGNFIGIGGVALTATGGLLTFAAQLPGIVSGLGTIGTGLTALNNSLPVLSTALGSARTGFMGLSSSSLAGAVGLGAVTLAVTLAVKALWDAYRVQQQVKTGQEEAANSWDNLTVEMLKSGKSASEVADIYAQKMGEVRQILGETSEFVLLFAGNQSKYLPTHKQMNTAIAEASTSYEDYYGAATMAARATKEYNDWTSQGLTDQEALAASFSFLSWSEWLAVQATGELKDEFADGKDLIKEVDTEAALAAGSIDEMVDPLEAVTKAMEELNYVMAGELDKELADFSEKQWDLRVQADQLKATIGELEGKEYLTDDQAQELDDARSKLKDVEDQVWANADAHDKATARILFDLAQQKLAASDLSAQTQFDVLQGLAEQLNLVNDASAQANMAMNLLLANTTEANADNLAGAIAYLNDALKDGKTSADELKLALDILNGTKIYTEIEIKTYYNGPIPPDPGYQVGGTTNTGRDKPANETAVGGAVNAFEPTLYNENPATRPELFVPARNGYMLTRQDAMQAVREGAAGERREPAAAGGQMVINNITQNFTREANPRQTRRSVLNAMRAVGLA